MHFLVGLAILIGIIFVLTGTVIGRRILVALIVVGGFAGYMLTHQYLWIETWHP